MNRILRRVRPLVRWPARWLAPRVGLRWRTTLGFAVGALILSGVLASIAYGLTRESLLDQRESATRSAALVNAEAARSSLQADAEPADAISGHSRSSGSGPLLRHRGQWFPGEGLPDSSQLPDELVRLVVEERQPARMRFEVDGTTYIGVGLPLQGLEQSGDASYFYLAPLEEVASALESLLIALVVACVVTVFVGAVIGWLGARRTFRPLQSIREAARRLAAGDYQTRVDAGDDPDLVPLANSFNHMVETLHRRLEADARFASNVTHELRSPLTTLSASLSVLENMRDELPDRAQTAADLLAADVNRFTQLIEDLLEISRLDAGVANVEPDRVLIAELIMYAVDEQSDSEIPVDVSSDLAGVIIEVDKRRLLRVMSNLLDNAAKYGGGADRVELKVVDGMVQVAIEDRGPGIAPRDRHRIFDRFSRGWVEGERAKRKGVGLGLSIVDEHVRIHGGSVWVEGRPNDEPGARFVFTLPIDEEVQREGFADEEEDLSLPRPDDASGSGQAGPPPESDSPESEAEPASEETKDTLDV